MPLKAIVLWELLAKYEFVGERSSCFDSLMHFLMDSREAERCKTPDWPQESLIILLI